MNPQRPVVVLCPHFEPDTAPTGTVMTRIVAELVELGHEVHVVTSLPWYRNHTIDAGWGGRLVRREVTAWGSITRVHPFPGEDKSNLLRRALGFVAYSALAGFQGLRAGGWFRRSQAVIAMSPPLTLGLTGWLVSRLRRSPLIFNIQDVFPDAAVETGAITNRAVIGAAERLERISYNAADAVTVLSDDLADNVRTKLPAGSAGGSVRRQCRILTVSRPDRHGRPSASFGDLPHQRRWSCSDVTGGAGPRRSQRTLCRLHRAGEAW